MKYLYRSLSERLEAHMVRTRMYKTYMYGSMKWTKERIQSSEIVKRERNTKQQNDDEDGGVDIDPMQSFA